MRNALPVIIKRLCHAQKFGNWSTVAGATFTNFALAWTCSTCDIPYQCRCDPGDDLTIAGLAPRHFEAERLGNERR